MCTRLGVLASLVVPLIGCGSDAEVPPQKPDEPRSQTENSAPQAELTHVVIAETEYYTTGPQQGRPADGSFPVGTRVALLEEAGSYWRVRSEEGIEATVVASVLKPIDQKGVEEMSADVQAISAANTRFAFDLYQQFRTDEGNLFFSPASISTALAMTYAGAAGQTETQMAGVLHFVKQQDELHRAFAGLNEVLNSGDSEAGYRLTMANRLWGHADFEFLSEFLRITRDSYGAELARLDFAQQPEPSREVINDWVAEQTAGKIPHLMPEGSIDSLTRLVLTNAIYFKGDWKKPFREESTREAPFHLSADQQLDVPTMFQMDDFKYHQEEGLQILELPYGDDAHLAMWVLLPEQIDGLAQLERQLTGENLDRWEQSLRSQEVTVFLPKFQLTSQFDLVSVLTAMGMPDAFSPDDADFSRMSSQDRLYLAAAIHQAFVDVNEEGTEAAAATGVAAGITSAPAEPIIFRADRPFVFLIRDNRTESVLFLGRLVDPES